MLPRCENGGKVCFPKRDAQAQMHWLSKRGKDGHRRSHDKLHIYHCPYCNWWHLTSSDH